MPEIWKHKLNIAGTFSNAWLRWKTWFFDKSNLVNKWREIMHMKHENKHLLKLLNCGDNEEWIRFVSEAFFIV